MEIFIIKGRKIQDVTALKICLHVFNQSWLNFLANIKLFSRENPHKEKHTLSDTTSRSVWQQFDFFIDNWTKVNRMLYL